VPAQGGQPKQGPHFVQATSECNRLCDLAYGELDFKMIDNAYRQTMEAANHILPYADTWQMYH